VADAADGGAADIPHPETKEAVIMKISHMKNIAMLSGMLLASLAQAAAPNFSASVYGDGIA
jgi:hypothetical protein